jgi:hypothetical protein
MTEQWRNTEPPSWAVTFVSDSANSGMGIAHETVNNLNLPIEEKIGSLPASPETSGKKN